MPNDCLKFFNSFIVTEKESLKESLEGHYEMEVGVAPQTAKFRLNFQIEYFPPRTCFGRECEAAFLSRPPTVAAAGNSIITHDQQFVKRKVAQIINNYFSRICALLPIDFWYCL